MGIPLGLSFDDVLLVPKKTPLKSRSQADTTGWITSKIRLSVPFLSANMDTVTGAKMATALGKLGGMGVIHQFQSIDKEADEVKQVKKAHPDLPIAAAVGVNGVKYRAQALIKSQADLLVVDAAHGHSPSVADAVRFLKKKFPAVPVLAGNVATGPAAAYLIAAGASALKVGVGPGSACTTRVVAGAGVPQLSAIISVSKAIGSRRIGLIADGGIKQPGDVVKALAAGASAVMCGNVFAGTAESPGRIVIHQGKKYKQYRGSSTMAATKSRARRGDLVNVKDQWSRIEGVEAMVPFKGSVKPIVARFLGGLRSGMSYGGARNIKQLQKNASFIQISPAGQRESLPHDVIM